MDTLGGNVNYFELLVKAMSNVFVSIHILDINKGTFEEISAIPQIRNAIGSTGLIPENLNKVFSIMADPQHREAVIAFTDNTTLSERMRGHRYLSMEFLGTVNGWCKIYYMPLNYNPDGSLASAVFAVQRIDEEKRREIAYQDALRRATKKAEEASDAKSRFLAQMSHEIRTPLSGMIGLGELLAREPLHYTAKKYIDDINISSKNLLNIVNDILDVSRLEADKIEILKAPYTITGLVHELNVIIEPQAAKKGLRFDVEINNSVPDLLKGDVDRLRQIILNLLTNAVKYTREGFVKLFISAAPQGTGNYLLHVEVSDTGIGVKTEDIPLLFESFSRVEEARNKGIQGTGLGLPIVKRLLKLMGSDLKVTSVYGEGSTFYFDVNQEYCNPLEIEKLTPDIPELKIIPRDMRILAVDDNLINLTVLSGFLHKLGLSPTCVNSGQKCLDKIAENEYDLIFLDHMMPEMDGIDTLNAIRKNKNHKCVGVPVVMLTANALNGAEEQYLSMGFQGFLAKPIDQEKLRETLLQYC